MGKGTDAARAAGAGLHADVICANVCDQIEERGHGRTRAMDWTACAEHLPPRPETPYKRYMVRVLQQIDNATGAARLHQLCRETGTWLPLPLGPSGVPQTVTHWCDALNVLGSPNRKPYGPRGKTLNVAHNLPPVGRSG